MDVKFARPGLSVHFAKAANGDCARLILFGDMAQVDHWLARCWDGVRFAVDLLFRLFGDRVVVLRVKHYLHLPLNTQKRECKLLLSPHPLLFRTLLAERLNTLTPKRPDAQTLNPA